LEEDETPKFPPNSAPRKFAQLHKENRQTKKGKTTKISKNLLQEKFASKRGEETPRSPPKQG
jgi:hypothetical protein